MELSWCSLSIILYIYPLMQFSGKVFCQDQFVSFEVSTNSTLKPVNGKTSRPADQCGLRDTFVPDNGDYPWLGVIVALEVHNYFYSCNGNLISNRHLLTTAHCLAPYKENGTVDKLLVVLGKHHVEKWSKHLQGSPNYTVEAIHIHPDYKATSADADIAVLTLTQEVPLSTSIRPICLWTGGTEIEDIKGDIGVIGGWRTYGAGLVARSPAPEVNLTIVDQVNCIRYHRNFTSVTSEQTFCATPGGKGYISPCSGGSGSGFMMERNGIWILRGILSKWIEDITYICDASRYLVFTDVSKFSNWTLSIINK